MNTLQVYIVGHVPPGYFEKKRGKPWFRENFNKRYIEIIQKHHGVIQGQFFGHHHTDSFRMFYSNSGSYIFLNVFYSFINGICIFYSYEIGSFYKTFDISSYVCLSKYLCFPWNNNSGASSLITLCCTATLDQSAGCCLVFKGCVPSYIESVSTDWTMSNCSWISP